MEELQELKAKLAVLGTKVDTVGQTIISETDEIKAGVNKLIDGLKSEPPIDLSSALIEAEALVGKLDNIQSAVLGMSDKVLPVSPSEPVTEAPVEPSEEVVVE